ncbi:hypothetical protein HYW60_01760 [Candidatus Kaiserbacteria bacterium]|nr:hypothetical protein [Candidatus Kaiserbacteria bacterium]
MKPISIIQYVLIALVVVMLAALAGWYFFLKEERTNITEEDVGRGIGLPQPFSEQIGSTYENIVSSFSTLVGGIIQSEENGLPRLTQVGKTPTAGHAFVQRDGVSQLRFVERGSGYIFDVSPETGALERLTNTLVPRTYEALVAGDRVIMRGIDEAGAVATVAGEISTSTSPQAPATLKQRRLVNNIRSIAMDPSGAELFYIVDTLQGSAGIRTSWDEKKQKKIFDSAVLGWQIDFLSDGRITAVENASDNAAGHAYLVRENSLQPIVENVQGLTFLPHPKLSAHLYGSSAQNVSLFARTDAISTVLLPIRTVADKCVWAPSALTAYCAVPQQLPPTNFLDAWYRGEMHTSDAWWKVDVSANAAEPLYGSANTTFDVEEPAIDANGNYIAFGNAIDKTLWLLRIEE